MVSTLKSADVLGMILRQGMAIVLIGCVAGLAGALACGIAGFLFQTAPADPVVLAGICILLLSATMLASYLPARRATHIDPMAALSRKLGHPSFPTCPAPGFSTFWALFGILVPIRTPSTKIDSLKQPMK